MNEPSEQGAVPPIRPTDSSSEAPADPIASPPANSEPPPPIPPTVEAPLLAAAEPGAAETIPNAAPALATPPDPPPLFAAPPAPVVPAVPPASAAHPIVFHGKTEEYFRIWIVNTFLTLITLGVFFSWAKVRKRRYFRGSTELMGHRFDYRASPVRLLVGHAVVLVFFLGYSLFGVVYPWVRYSVLAIGVVLLPWIVVRSMTFNAHNTVYRGLRFRFNRSLSAAAKVYLLEPVLLALTLGLYYPAWQRSKREYAVSNHRLGDAYFRFDGGAGAFYFAYFISGLMLFGAVLVGLGIVGVLAALGQRAQFNWVQLLPFFVVYGFGFFVSRHFIYARLFNHVWNHTRVDDHRFRAKLRGGKWLGLQLTNLGAILITAGMLYPWATIRAQRYAASCLEFVPAGPLDRIQRVGGSAGSGTGDMAAEFVGLDFGL